MTSIEELKREIARRKNIEESKREINEKEAERRKLEKELKELKFKQSKTGKLYNSAKKVVNKFGTPNNSNVKSNKPKQARKPMNINDIMKGLPQ